MGNLEQSPSVAILHIIKLIGRYESYMGIDETIHLQSIEYWRNVKIVNRIYV